MRIWRYIGFAYVLLAVAVVVSAQPRVQSVKWRTVASKTEFSVAMPDGIKSYAEDNEYFVGKNRSRVSKRVFIFTSINGAALLTELIEGDVKGVRDTLASQLQTSKPGYELKKSQTIGDVSIDTYSRQKDKLFSLQQFVLFKNRLYILQAHSVDENSLIVSQYFRSLAVSEADKTAMPNIGPNDDVKLALGPPDIVLLPQSKLDEPIDEKPDRDVVIVHKPRPRYTSELRRSGATGAVAVKVLFSAAGTVEKIEFKSGKFEFFEVVKAAAENILFMPAEKSGRLVPVWKTLEYHFDIF